VELDSVVSDLHYLSAHPSLHRWLRSDDAGARAAVAADYAAFATQKARYERIRLVTPDGQEAVRIDWDDDTRTAGPAANLRSGAVPDFIAAALRLGPNAVHVSAFELDTEDGVIVQPIVPLIRFASPIYEDGQLRGAVVLSY